MGTWHMRVMATLRDGWDVVGLQTIRSQVLTLYFPIQVVYDDGDEAQEMLVLQTVQFPKVPVGAAAAWPTSSASQLEGLGAILASEAEKEEQRAKSKTGGTKRSKEVAKGGDSGELPCLSRRTSGLA